MVAQYPLWTPGASCLRDGRLDRLELSGVKLILFRVSFFLLFC